MTSTPSNPQVASVMTTLTKTAAAAATGAAAAATVPTVTANVTAQVTVVFHALPSLLRKVMCHALPSLLRKLQALRVKKTAACACRAEATPKVTQVCHRVVCDQTRTSRGITCMTSARSMRCRHNVSGTTRARKPCAQVKSPPSNSASRRTRACPRCFAMHHLTQVPPP